MTASVNLVKVFIMQKYEYPKIRYSAGYQVIHIHDHIDFKEIEPKFDTFIQSKYPDLNLEDLNGWKVVLSATYRYTSELRIVKRPVRYPTDKEIYVFFTVPIPDLTQAKYGIGNGGEKVHELSDSNKCFILETDFSKYENLKDYVYESVIRCIDESFKQGFTVNGKKIKYQH